MAGRRHSPVPVYEWRKAFADLQKTMAMALRNITLTPEEEAKVPKYRLVVRLVLNRTLLSALRQALAEHPGIENAEQIKEAAIGELRDFVNNFAKFEPMVRDALKASLVRQGVNPNEVDLAKYLDLIKEVAAKTAEYLATGAGIASPLAKAAEQAMAA